MGVELLADPLDEMTERQRAIYELRAWGVPYKEIAASMGISPKTAINVFQAMKGRYGPPDPGKRLALEKARALAQKEKTNEKSLKKHVKGALRAVGASPAEADQLMKNLDREIKAKPRKYDKEDLARVWLNLVYEANGAITPEHLEKASAVQLATVMGIGTDKLRLLSGEPTEIISIEERRVLDQNVGLLLDEARRRGMRIEIDEDSTPRMVKTIDVERVDP